MYVSVLECSFIPLSVRDSTSLSPTPLFGVDSLLLSHQPNLVHFLGKSQGCLLGCQMWHLNGFGAISLVIFSEVVP